MQKMKKNRNIPFGYCMVNGKYAINAVEAAAVKEIFTDYSAGKSLTEIAAKMTVPYHSDKPLWNKNMVKRVLENRRYIGECGYPQIIENRIFYEVQKIKIQKNTRKKIKNKEPEIEKLPQIREYEITENIRCMTNEINRLLDAPDADKSEIKMLIFKCAEEKYNVL